MKVGQFVELKTDNMNGIGRKGDKGVVLYKLFKDADSLEIMVKFVNGTTEAFLEKELTLSAKTLDKLHIIK